jgi:hypothetical protein
MADRCKYIRGASRRHFTQIPPLHAAPQHKNLRTKKNVTPLDSEMAEAPGINTTVAILKSSPTHGICKTRDFHIARRHADKKGERGSGDGRCCGRPRRRRHRCPFLRLLFNRDAITADATHPRVTATSSDTYRFPIQDRRRWSSSLD